MHWEYLDWPKSWREAAISRPVHVLNVTCSAGRLELCATSIGALCDRDMSTPTVFFPKLGAKSWRNGRGTHPISNDVLLVERLSRLLETPTWQQTRIVTQLEAEKQPIHLYLFEWVDFTTWSEGRVYINGPEARLTSFVKRTAPSRLNWKADVIAFAKGLSLASRDLKALDIDVAFRASGELMLIEVNPTLSGLPAGVLVLRRDGVYFMTFEGGPCSLGGQMPFGRSMEIPAWKEALGLFAGVSGA